MTILITSEMDDMTQVFMDPTIAGNINIGSRGFWILNLLEIILFFFFSSKLLIRGCASFLGACGWLIIMKKLISQVIRQFFYSKVLKKQVLHWCSSFWFLDRLKYKKLVWIRFLIAGTLCILLFVNNVLTYILAGRRLYSVFGLCFSCFFNKSIWSI